jgi:hypothetical protein
MFGMSSLQNHVIWRVLRSLVPAIARAIRAVATKEPTDYRNLTSIKRQTTQRASAKWNVETHFLFVVIVPLFYVCVRLGNPSCLFFFLWPLETRCGNYVFVLSLRFFIETQWTCQYKDRTSRTLRAIQRLKNEISADIWFLQGCGTLTLRVPALYL